MTLAVFNLGHAWHIAAIELGLLLSVLATGHAALNKRGPRAAIAWAGLSGSCPGRDGPLLHLLSQSHPA